MKLERKITILLHKTYLDTGLGLTYYVKYLVALIGLTSQDLVYTLWFALAYCILGYLLGFLYYKYGWAEAAAEVSNRFNLFVKEMRKSVKRKI